ncbi:MAG TPA: HAD family phosphatase [Patescibacteria group bacterium]|nr:HAD family phosphatase [Patescibacteria group bacterium]
MIKDKNKIKTVIFDWGGVCVSGGELFTSEKLQAVLGLAPGEITEKLGEAYFDYYKGKYSRDNFWQKVTNLFDLKINNDINPDSLSAAYIGSYQVRESILGIVRRLKDKGYKVALLSNLTPEMRDHIKVTHKLDELFDFQVYSCDEDVKIVKPNKEIYKLIINRLDNNFEECLFIDDSSENILSADELGIQTILFETENQFLDDIKELL